MLQTSLSRHAMKLVQNFAMHGDANGEDGGLTTITAKTGAVV